jgi:hypothetical protein
MAVFVSGSTLLMMGSYLMRSWATDSSSASERLGPMLFVVAMKT